MVQASYVKTGALKMFKYDFYTNIQQYFPEFDYNNPAGDRDVLCDMRNPGNMVGHQQRAFTVYWALKQCNLLDLGLDLGSHRGLSPYCIHVDLYYGNGKPHPYYGGEVSADVLCNASKLVPFPTNTFPFVSSNHSVEHMPGNDNDIIDMLCNEWIRVLRPGGVLAMIIPDNDSFDVMASDKDHKNAWGRNDFRHRILDPMLAKSGAELIEYSTFNNNFSFNVVIRKK